MTGARVLVTGAASGIGRSTAYAFAEKGADLILVDLSAAGLERTARMVGPLGGRVVRREVVDVSDRGAMQALAAGVHRDLGPLDILVNNAGIGLGGDFVDTSLDDWERIIAINVMGVVHGCHFFVPAMQEQGRGHVFNVASLAGLVSPRGMSAYAATKFAVVGLSGSLRAELHASGVRVTTVCPGFVTTPIMRSSRFVGRYDGDAVRQRLMHVYRRRGFGPDGVADAIVGAVPGPGGVLPVTAEAQIMSRLQRFLPGLVTRFSQRMDIAGAR